MGRIDGKVALITGAARGQGRAHALRLAEEGADIVAVDFCEDIPTVPYAMASAEDLSTTATQVEHLDRRVITHIADVRDSAGMDAAVAAGIDAFGKIDVVCANAGICSFGNLPDEEVKAHMAHEMSDQAWDEMLDINLNGVWRTAKATVPQMIERDEGGSIIFTSSTAGLRGFPNMSHYAVAKHGVIGLMRSMANELAQYNIRVNAVCPTSVDTDMTNSPAIARLFRPDLEAPTREDAKPGFALMNLMDVPWVDPVDISNAYLFLASDEARFVTGHALPVDAGNIALFGVNPVAQTALDQ